MSMTLMSSREFNQDSAKAKRAALAGPVFITHRGRPSHVLLTFAEYEKLAGHGRGIVELLAEPEGLEDVEFEFPRLGDSSFPAQFD